jgi:hypothetical protein
LKKREKKNESRLESQSNDKNNQKNFTDLNFNSNQKFSTLFAMQGCHLVKSLNKGFVNFHEKKLTIFLTSKLLKANETTKKELVKILSVLLFSFVSFFYGFITKIVLFT